MRAFIESLPHPDGHLDAWKYINDRVESYPDDVNIKPYRKPRFPELAKGIYTLELRRYGRLTADGGGVTLTSCAVDELNVHILTLDAAGFDALRRVLFADRRRGKLQVFAQGTAAEFRQLLDLYGKQLLAAGYVVNVLGSLMRIVALRITKGGRVWWLCDAEAVTGVPFEELNAQIGEIGAVAGKPEPYCRSLYTLLEQIQKELVTRFNVSLHPTIGQAAAKAASWHIPDGVWLWRPSPTFVGMCRAGGGFRGSYNNSIDYEGPAWKMDVRRQYTAALRSELPYAVSFGPWSETGMASRGLFMCTVRGPGRLRVLLNVWNPLRRRFELVTWYSTEWLAILPTAEIEGLAALGFLVLPGWGFWFNRTFNLAPFVSKLQTLTEIHGAESVLGQVCKSLGSKVWGKWAQSPDRTEVAYAADRPGPEWSPMCRDDGDEIENLWTAERVSYNSLQHVELATVITAVARAQVYKKVAQLIDRGYLLAQVMADSIIVQGDAPAHPPPKEGRIGAWRYEGWSPHAVTRSTGAYVWQERARRPGKHGTSVAEVISLGNKEAPPGGEAPIATPRLRYVR